MAIIRIASLSSRRMPPFRLGFAAFGDAIIARPMLGHGRGCLPSPISPPASGMGFAAFD